MDSDGDCDPAWDVVGVAQVSRQSFRAPPLRGRAVVLRTEPDKPSPPCRASIPELIALYEAGAHEPDPFYTRSQDNERL